MQDGDEHEKDVEQELVLRELRQHQVVVPLLALRRPEGVYSSLFEEKETRETGYDEVLATRGYDLHDENELRPLVEVERGIEEKQRQ